MYDAIVLAGGRSRRMGEDKTRLEVDGVSLLDRVLGATGLADRTIVVGPERPTVRRVDWALEPVVGAGPVAALRAGIELVSAERVVLLAADLPHLTPPLVQLLVDEAPVVLMGAGRPQWLCSAWPTHILRAALSTADTERLGQVLRTVEHAELTFDDDAWMDCDTPEDLERARRRHG
ncbi:MAG: molybdenum cofactor guanylyltransferase [Frankiales bacterium]|nr:molybdenum cofactor guanylyltransferase [Frankiales bacterium]